MGKAVGIFFMVLFVAQVSCSRLNPFHEEEVVARVGERKLYLSEVSSIFTPDLTPEDSLKLLESYVDRWVKTQLKIGRAETIFQESQADIERMVEDYRNSLLIFRLDQRNVEARLDTMVTDSTITAYYDHHRSDFTLDRTIVKGRIVKLPASHRQRGAVKELMTAEGERYQDMLDMASKNNFTVHEVAAWMDFADFLNLLPTNKLRDYDDLLTGGVHEMRDGEDLYLVLVTSHLNKGDVSPRERVNEMIRRVVVNQRRQEILRSYEDSLYDTALRDNEFEIRVR